MLKFEQDGALPDGEKTYRLVIDGVETAAGLQLDQVVRAINRRDEEKLGEDHGPETHQSPPRAAATAPLAGEPKAEGQRKLAAATAPFADEPRAERRRKAAAGPGWRR